MIQIHKHDKGELYSIYGFFIDPDKDVWVNKKQLMDYFGIIEWSDEEAMFLLTCIKNPKSAVRGISDGISDEITQQKLEDCELVGCIHDPEWQEKLNLKDE